MHLGRSLIIPISLVYGLITWVRNKLFDFEVLPQRRFEIPVIGIGNLSSGGTGKTPLIEYLAPKLKENHNVAVLSRGYKRKGRGFEVVGENSTAIDVGDEALQIYRKNPGIVVAVNNCRVRGVEAILERFPETNLILLDDSFQHRYVKPDLNLLLSRFSSMFYDDFLLPSGYLREFRSGVKRADAIVVTNTPRVLSPIVRKLVLEKVRKYFAGKVFFSTVDYGDFVPLGNHGKCFPKRPRSILLFSGIASTTALEDHLRKICDKLILKQFPDHYFFKERDIISLKSDFYDLYGHSKVIVVTEKDAMRLQAPKLMNLLKGLPIFYLPMQVRFQCSDNVFFDNFVSKYLLEFHSAGKASHCLCKH